jgi:hypothetical protein
MRESRHPDAAKPKVQRDRCRADFAGSGLPGKDRRFHEAQYLFRAGHPARRVLQFGHLQHLLTASDRLILLSQAAVFRLAPTNSTGTLGFSRLARRSIFIVVCTFADWLTFQPEAVEAMQQGDEALDAKGSYKVAGRDIFLPLNLGALFTARRSFALPAPGTSRLDGASP